jgi:restriction system protein
MRKKNTKRKGDKYEEHCARKLRFRGCIVERIGASGDFGADLIIKTFFFRRLAIVQCKYLTGATAKVGTKAVQEAFTARQYYGAQKAIVCTNRTYTKSARELAAVCGVELYENF